MTATSPTKRIRTPMPWTDRGSARLSWVHSRADAWQPLQTDSLTADVGAQTRPHRPGSLLTLTPDSSTCATRILRSRPATLVPLATGDASA
jgi:hypothetical protein